MAMIAPMEILNKAGQYYNEKKEITDANSFFDVRLISLNSKMVNTANNYPIYCHNTISDVEHLDLILIPGLDGNIKDLL